MTNKISAKFFELFRNMKSDAVPRPPRPNSFQENPDDIRNENVNNINDNTTEEIFNETNNSKKEKKKTKYKKSFSTPEPDPTFTEDDDDRRSSNTSSVVNTQASGNVINIVNASNIRWGNEFVYYLSPVNGHQTSPKTTTNEEVVKTNLIKLLMESDVQPEHEYIDYISKNLGKNWHSVFRSLGYTKGQIETAEIDNYKNGVAEARYKLLLDWVRNDDDRTLGKLATTLWEEDERHVVKELAVIYKRNQK